MCHRSVTVDPPRQPSCSPIQFSRRRRRIVESAIVGKPSHCEYGSVQQQRCGVRISRCQEACYSRNSSGDRVINFGSASTGCPKGIITSPLTKAKWTNGTNNQSSHGQPPSVVDFSAGLAAASGCNSAYYNHHSFRQERCSMGQPAYGQISRGAPSTGNGVVDFSAN
jgi:hypothetical protein